MKKPVKKTRAQLEHKIIETEAQLASTYHFASYYIDKCSTDHLMASGVLVKMYFIGGGEAVLPFLVKDGFSPETIAAIKADLKRSYERATEFKP